MTDTMEKTSTSATFVITVGLLFALKREAAKRGVSVSELVRELLNAAIEREATAA
jgi:predicted DNA binding CopG/RHH family protein